MEPTFNNQGIGSNEYTPSQQPATNPYHYQQQQVDPGTNVFKQVNQPPPMMMTQPLQPPQQQPPQASILHPQQQQQVRRVAVAQQRPLLVRVSACGNHPTAQATRTCAKCGLHICGACQGGYGPLSGDMGIIAYTIVVILVVTVLVILGFLLIACLVFLVFFGAFFIFIPRFGLLTLCLGDTGPKAVYCRPCFEKYSQRKKTKSCICLIVTFAVLGSICCCVVIGVGITLAAVFAGSGSGGSS